MSLFELHLAEESVPDADGAEIMTKSKMMSKFEFRVVTSIITAKPKVMIVIIAIVLGASDPVSLLVLVKKFLKFPVFELRKLVKSTSWNWSPVSTLMPFFNFFELMLLFLGELKSL